MAAGLACGLLLGLIPKGNLLAILVVTLLLATRMSLATGMLAAFCVSLVAPWCDPLTDRIGHWILTTFPLTICWRALARLPLAAWTSFNNTVVMGSLVLGTFLMYPTYRLSLPAMIRLHERRRKDGEPPSEPQTAIPLPATLGHEALPDDSTPVDPPPLGILPARGTRIVPRRAHAGHTAKRADKMAEAAKRRAEVSAPITLDHAAQLPAGDAPQQMTNSRSANSRSNDQQEHRVSPAKSTIPVRRRSCA